MCPGSVSLEPHSAILGKGLDGMQVWKKRSNQPALFSNIHLYDPLLGPRIEGFQQFLGPLRVEHLVGPGCSGQEYGSWSGSRASSRAGRQAVVVARSVQVQEPPVQGLHFRGQGDWKGRSQGHCGEKAPGTWPPPGAWAQSEQLPWSS